jgi:hypothetical protein
VPPFILSNTCEVRLNSEGQEQIRHELERDIETENKTSKRQEQTERSQS